MNGEKTIVSIIIPAYNVENYIHRGIQSAIEQSYQDIEVVIVDDGSTDKTAEIVKMYQEKDNRIKLYQQTNKGVSAARNRALDYAEGKYILFLDSDDWLEIDAVSELMKIKETMDGGLVCCERYFAYCTRDGSIVKEQQGSNEVKQRVDSDKAQTYCGIGKYNLQSSCYKLFDKKVIDNEKIRFNEDIYHGEDGLFVFSYLKCIKEVIYIPLPLWNILERPNSATTAPYNSKWLTAIEAVQEMIKYENNSYEVKQALYLYLMKRVTQMEILGISAGKMNSEKIKELQKILKDTLGLVKKEKLSFKQRMKYRVFGFLPIWMIKMVVYVLNV